MGVGRRHIEKAMNTEIHTVEVVPEVAVAVGESYGKLLSCTLVRL